MLHKISQMCDRIKVMYEKSEELRRLKYDVPKEEQKQYEIDELVLDIQALARSIANDTMPYNKLND
jgi:hypothetical protein|tara:strand:- start:1977 stop:2174 length:198 start_codon:yes stop_codon:yes gene_type:complete